MKSKLQKKENVERLTALRKNRSPSQQLIELDKRLGEGIGAQKERSRLVRELTLRVSALPTAKEE